MPTIFGSTEIMSSGPIIRNQHSNHLGLTHSVSNGTELQSQHLMRPADIELDDEDM